MRALIIEDNIRICAFIAEGLERAGFATDSSHNLQSATELLNATAFDIIILDLGLPDGNGIDWLKHIRAAGNALPVLVLTARDGIGDRVSGLDGGADDYMVKPFELDELMARCRALMRRPAEALSSQLSVGNVVLDLTNRTTTVAAATVDLGKRETDFLESLMRRAGRVVTRESLETQVYSFNDEVTPNAIEVALSRLRRKLNEAGCSAEIRTIRGVGYMMGSE